MISMESEEGTVAVNNETNEEPVATQSSENVTEDPPSSSEPEKLLEGEQTPGAEVPANTDDSQLSDQTASKTSNRELKSLLELSKEAKLDTNIAHKRKSLVQDQERPLTPKQQLKKVNKKDVEEEEVKSIQSKPSKRKRESISEASSGSTPEGKKGKKDAELDLSLMLKNKDPFCWRCHKGGVTISCETCSRSFHLKCIKFPTATHWQCSECIQVLKAENVQTRPVGTKGLSLEQLCKLLKFALKRMIVMTDTGPFLQEVNQDDFPDYKKYIIQPMDLDKLGKNIQANLYGSTHAFEADAKWILHNSIIYNSYQSKLTTIAKAILKACKQEMFEIETCPTCYENANTSVKWFVQACPKPHTLIWAKLKGFPYWPAKAMSTNSSGMVDVRFFGAHDRAWVSPKDCYLYTTKNPNNNQMKKNEINECIQEVSEYLNNLKKAFGPYKFPPHKTPFYPSKDYSLTVLPKYKYPTKGTKASLKEYNSKSVEDDGVTENIEEEESNGTDTSLTKAPTPIVPDVPENSVDTAKVNAATKASVKAYTPRTSDQSTKADEKDDEGDEDSTSDEGDDEETDAVHPLIGHITGDSLDAEDACDLKSDAEDEVNNSSLKGSPEKEQTSIEDNRKKIESPEKQTPPKPMKISDTLIQRLSGSEASLETINKSPIKETPKTSKELVERPVPPLVLISHKKLLRTEAAKTDVLVDTSIEFNTVGIVDDSCTVRLQRLKSNETREEQNNEATVIENGVESDIPFDNKIDEVEDVTMKLNKEVEEVKNNFDIALDDVELKQVEEEKVPEKGETSVVEAEETLDKARENKVERKIEPKVNDVKTNSLKETGIDFKLRSKKLESKYLKTKRTDSAAKHKNKVHDKFVNIKNRNKLLKSNKPRYAENDLLAVLYSERIDGTKLNHEKKFDDSSLSDSDKKANDENGSAKKRQFEEDSDTEFNVTISKRQHKKIKPIIEPSMANDQAARITQERPKRPSVTLAADKNLEKAVDNSLKMLKKNNNNNLGNKNDAVVLSEKAETAPVIEEVDIKSEPMSELESDEEIEDYTAKKTLLSALNISEKSNVPIVHKPKEMRTRSKTEEISNRMKYIDNLSRTIDDVACGKNNEVEKSSAVATKQQKKGEEPTKKPEKSAPRVMPKIKLKNLLGDTHKNSRCVIKKVVHKSTITIPPQNNQQSPVCSNAVNVENPVTPVLSTPTSVLATNTTTLAAQPSGLMLLPQSLMLPAAFNQSVATNPILTMVPTTTSFTNFLIPPGKSFLTAQSAFNGLTLTQPEAQHPETPQPTQPSHLPALTLQPETPTSSPVITMPQSDVQVSRIEGNGHYLNIALTTTPSRENPLREALQENYARTVSEVLTRAPPRLKPRPAGPLSFSCEQSLPSSTGPMTAQINSIAHRLSDYFRGMLMETLKDIGSKTDNAEATIASLQAENEMLKARHKEEVDDMKRNMNALLEDLHKDAAAEKEKLVQDTRATWEAETIRRVEEAKSKQWCANCMKEAQFYCCWNTSYCDYPCQSKHWPKHMAKCTHYETASSQQGLTMTPGINQPIILRPTAPPKFQGLSFQKPLGSKLIVNKKGSKVPLNLGRTSASNHITVLESTPGNFELVGSSTMSADNRANLNKLINNPAIQCKIKPGNVIMVSSSSTDHCGPKTLIIQSKSPASNGSTGKSSSSVSSSDSPE